MFALFVVLAVASFGSTEGSKWVSGTCPKWQSLPRYALGEELFYKPLYLQRSFNNYIFEDEGKCGKLYNSVEHGLLMSTYQYNRTDGTPKGGFFVAPLASDEHYSKTLIMDLTLYNSAASEPLKMAAMIVATDLKNYSVIYSCRSILDRTFTLDTNPRKMETVLVFTAKQGDTSFDEKIRKEVDLAM